MSDLEEFEKVLQKAHQEYERITGDAAKLHSPVWNRGHHAMVVDIMSDYKISVRCLFDTRWMATCHNDGCIGLGSCPVEAVLKCFIDYALHQPDSI